MRHDPEPWWPGWGLLVVLAAQAVTLSLGIVIGYLLAA